MASGTLDLGAPILEATGNGAAIVSDGVVVADGFEAVVLVKTATNVAAQNAQAAREAAAATAAANPTPTTPTTTITAPATVVYYEPGSENYNMYLDGWIYPFLWEGAQILGVDTPTIIVYEFLALGL